MKKQLIGIGAICMLLGGAGLAQATLTTIGTATYNGSDYNLIWDDDNNGNSVVWLDYTNTLAEWPDQMSWAAGLEAALMYNIDTAYTVTWEDTEWRLSSAGVNPSNGGYNITTSEMGDLYYNELGLLSQPERGSLVTDEELNETNFNNLIATFYWTDTQLATNTDYVYYFGLINGLQAALSDLYSPQLEGLAIRTGQVTAAEPVPEPATMLLFGTGLAGLAGYRKRRKK